MLRPTVAGISTPEDREAERGWRVSSGSAAVLGLRALHMDAAPTTAYLMLGQRCRRNCAFCTQARESQAQADALSRVTWPAYPATQVVEAIARAYQEGQVLRACLQVTVSPGYLEEAERALRALRRASALPVCTSVVAQTTREVAALLQAGAERVTLALDAACERVYHQVKGGSWSRALALLESCARLYPGHMGTHLIVGLGETEREMAECMQHLTDLGLTIGLFAFTPVRGTALAGWQPPSLAHYRRMQVAHWLLTNRLARAADFAYDAPADSIRDFGMSAVRLRGLLAGGEAFRTSGCPGCNRPYYNESPGGVMYNYPRLLTPAELTQEIEVVIAHSLV